MKYFKQAAKYGVAATGVAVATMQNASATIVTEASTALTAATADASTVGGYVVAAVATIAAIGIILTLVRKA